MSRITAPLLSFDARGQIAKTQVYSSWKGRPYVRRYVVPANPNSLAQQATRSTFSFLNNVWKFMPGGAVGGWDLYAQTSRFTSRNGWIKQNLSALIGEADLANMTISPSARSGLIAAGMVLTPGDDQIAVALTAPTLPTGWAVASAYAAAIVNQDPQTGTDYTVVSGDDATDPYSITLTGLQDATEYLVGGWFEFTRPDGTSAFGQSLQDTATTT